MVVIGPSEVVLIGASVLVVTGSVVAVGNVVALEHSNVSTDTTGVGTIVFPFGSFASSTSTVSAEVSASSEPRGVQVTNGSGSSPFLRERSARSVPAVSSAVNVPAAPVCDGDTEHAGGSPKASFAGVKWRRNASVPMPGEIAAVVVSTKTI